MKEVIAHLREYFKGQIGLNPETVNTQAWLRCLTERMKACQVEDAEAYIKRHLHTPYETQEFIELIVVPETWFFRDRKAMDFLVEHAKKDWFALKEGKILHILSVPCASGEEPYSIAMALLDVGFTPQQFVVDALDVSKLLLNKARAGLYKKNSFRGADLTFRDRYFKLVGNQYQIRPDLKQLVHFKYGNIAERAFSKKLHHYDAIFCRNLLIYLHPEAQRLTFHHFNELLKTTGLLFLGPSETELGRLFGFMPVSNAKYCAFHKKASQGDTHAKKQPALAATPSSLLYELRQQEAKANSEPSMIDATDLANQGSFDAAAAICLAYLDHEGVNPSSYFLLGVIQLAKGQEDTAEEFFQKTIYLEPTHHKALVYLALLADKKGDEKQAALYRERAKKSHDPNIHIH